MSQKLIIHFTSKFDSIKSIVESQTLRLSYSEEDFFMGNLRVSSAAHPMVCFSEYDSHELTRKKITYGQYGIGFTDLWALKNRISPVIYINQNSMAAMGLGRLLRARRNKVSQKMPKELRMPIIQLKCFTKNERGYNSYLKKHDFNFKDENEWRFVPEKADIGDGLISQDKSRYKMRKDYYNERLIPYPLKFKLSDVEVVYVSNAKEVLEMKELLQGADLRIEICSWKR